MTTTVADTATSRMEPSLDYRATVELLSRSGRLYKDPDFPLPSRIPTLGLAKKLTWLRPKEASSNPVFIDNGTTRLDIQQGIVQDCFLLAGIACIAVTNKQLFERVIPPNQNFKENYTGLFYFNFWANGAWVEVWVDDRLPYCKGRPIFAFKRAKGVPHEFWVSLMEKAYAKLKGGYHKLKGGFINEAMVDMTGGISERIMLSTDHEQLAPSLFGLLVKTNRMASLMGCSIESEKLEEEDLGNGLYGGHAYSITSLAEIPYRGDTVRLVRVRNPWGETEWRGPWSDKSDEWRSVPEEVKDSIGFHKARDGEFWMRYEDWLEEFDEVSICHLTPAAFLAERFNEFANRKCWNVLTFHSQWIEGVSAGGCGNKEFPPDLYWTNPQFSVIINADQDNALESSPTLIVSLSQKTNNAAENKYISFKIFEVRDNNVGYKDKYSKDELALIKFPKDYMNIREVTGHFTLKPAHYVVVPSTFDPGQEAEFLLRVFTETSLRGC